MPRVDPQSSMRMISSCATSTRRRVRYPESAVRRAVSASPLRAPCVEMKYSRTERPSRKEDLIGRGIISPRGFDTSPFMPAICRICWLFPRAPESTIMSKGLKAMVANCLHGPSDLGVGRRPDLDLLLAPLVVGDDAPLELGLGLLGFLLVTVQDGLLVRRGLDVVDGDGQPGLGREAEAQRLDAVQAGG